MKIDTRPQATYVGSWSNCLLRRIPWMGARGRVLMRAAIVLAVLLMSAPVASAVPADQAAPPAGEPSGNNWSVYGGNFFNQRYSSLDQITPSNVASLKGAWTYHTGVTNTSS